MRSSVSMRYNLNEKTRLISKFEYRLKDNLTEKDKWNVNTSVRYDIKKISRLIPLMNCII